MAKDSILDVTGVAVQTLYNRYLKDKIIVNRKYQRKLVWTLEEKEKFIDSVANKYPVPLILTAEISGNETIEIIDGLQRLNSLFSFLDGEFPLNDYYFDPDTLAETRQKEKTSDKKYLDKDTCLDIVSYVLPISTYRVKNESDIEEVFRRINSGGRHLSKQEIRQAGSLEPIATLVRKISASIRNDFSVGDKVSLRDMQKISLTDATNTDGILFSDTFWIKHGILDKKQLRESRDEEVVLDILISMVQGRDSDYRSETFDTYYSSDNTSSLRDSFNAKISYYSDPTDYFISRFRKNIDIFEKIFSPEVGKFSNHFFESSKNRVPRYFESAFLAIDRLYFDVQKFSINDWDEVRNKLKSFGSKNLSTPSGSGTWNGESKKENIDLVYGILSQCSEPAEGFDDPLLDNSHLELKNLLQASSIEQQLFELKQGFSTLSDPPQENDNIVLEIGKTLSAMANKSNNSTGYLIVGISDKESDTRRIKQLTGDPRDFPVIANREICGLDLDIRIHGNFENVYMWFTNKFRNLPIEPSEFKDQILRDMKTIQVQDKNLLLLKSKSQNEPVSVGGKFYSRHGSRTDEIPTSSYKDLFDRFPSTN